MPRFRHTGCGPRLRVLHLETARGRTTVHIVRYFPYTALLSIRLDTPPPLSLLSASPPHHRLSFEVPVPTSLPSLRPSFVSLFRPLPCGYTGTMEATTLVLLVLLDCLLVSSSRPFRSSSGGPPMVCNFIKSDVEES
ncbi:unnamed protein product [Boreogadus saida]